MRVQYNLQLSEIQTLVGAVAEELGVNIRQLADPKFPLQSYTIGNNYTLNYNGWLVGPDNRELVTVLETKHNFIPDKVVYDNGPEYVVPTKSWHKPEDTDIEYKPELLVQLDKQACMLAVTECKRRIDFLQAALDSVNEAFGCKHTNYLILVEHNREAQFGMARSALKELLLASNNELDALLRTLNMLMTCS
jgi:hypothetical protein